MTKRSKRPPKVPDRERPVGREATRAKNPSTSSSGSVESAAESPQDQATLATSRGIIAAFVGQGSYLVIASWVGTAVLVVVSILGLVALDTFAPLVVGVSGLMFVAGSVAFFMAYAKAVSRSRFEMIGVGGLYFLSGTAPKHIRRSMMWSLGIQVAFVIGVIVAKPFSSMVFTSLAPVYPIGLAGCWGALYGKFLPRNIKLDS